MWRKLYTLEAEERRRLTLQDKRRQGGFPEEENSNLGFAGSIGVCQVDKVEKGVFEKNRMHVETGTG